MIADDYSPRYINDLSHPLSHTFVDGAGKPHDLTGVVAATISLIMVNTATKARQVGAGTWTIPDPLNGVGVYHWNSADVGTVGIFQMQATVPFPDGIYHFSIKEIEFKAPL